MTDLEIVAVAVSLLSHNCDLSTWQLACIYGGHNVLQSHDRHLQYSQPSSDKVNEEAIRELQVTVI